MYSYSIYSQIRLGKKNSISSEGTTVDTEDFNDNSEKSDQRKLSSVSTTAPEFMTRIFGKTDQLTNTRKESIVPNVPSPSSSRLSVISSNALSVNR